MDQMLFRRYFGSAAGRRGHRYLGRRSKFHEVDPRTVASRKAPGLYFAGEILDVDAYTGGFNLQIAWSTAFAAGAGHG